MTYNELKAKVESLRQELEWAEEQLPIALASEIGVKIGESLVRGNDGASG